MSDDNDVDNDTAPKRNFPSFAPKFTISEIVQNTSSRPLKPIATLGPAEMDVLCKAYDIFMNKSDVFILEESRINNQRIPSRGDRILVFDLDLSNSIEDKENNDRKIKKRVSFALYDCKKRMKHLSKLYNDIFIGEDSNKGVYLFSNGVMNIDIPLLDPREIDEYRFDFDFCKSEIKDIFYLGVVDGSETEEDILAIQKDSNEIIENVLRLFDNTKPIDILIRGGSLGFHIFGFQQGDNIIDTLGHYQHDLANESPLRSHASIILRAYNFYHYKHKEMPVKDTILKVIRNYDNEFWLVIEGGFCEDKDNPRNLKIYENLEWLRL